MHVIGGPVSGGGVMSGGSSSHYTQEELQSILLEILDECANGRTEGHHCPFCSAADMNAKIEDEFSVRLECSACGKYFEGQLA